MPASGQTLDQPLSDERVARALTSMEDALHLLDDIGTPDLAARLADLIDRLRDQALHCAQPDPSRPFIAL